MKVQVHLRTEFLAAVLALCVTSCSPDSGQVETLLPTEDRSQVEPRITRGTNRDVILNLDTAAQRLIGLETSSLALARLSPELKAYGRVLDVAPLVSLVAELVSSSLAAKASQAELDRLATLAAQNNTSERALQAAQAIASRDQVQVESARLRLVAGWGRELAERQDLPALVRTLSSLESALVKLELPAGEAPSAQPTGARLLSVTDASQSIQAKFVGPAPYVEPQIQGRDFLFLVESNQTRLTPGRSLIGFISLPGEPQTGVIVPRNAVVRFNGAEWVYRQNGDETFERVQVALGPPLAEGWFLLEGLGPQDRVVTVGAQQLLSEELKGQGEAE